MSSSAALPDVKQIKFDATKTKDFVSELRQNVNQYFTKNNINIYGNTYLWAKTIIAFSAYLIPYFLMLSGVITQLWVMYLLWAIMGVATATLGLSVMHDAIHGAFSKIPWVNKLMGQTMNIIGGNAYVWRMQHNVLHHTFTNINHVDDDIDIPFLMRMSPDQKRYGFQKFQHVYVWFLYSLASLFWITTKDFVQLNKYKQRGMMKDNKEYILRLLNLIGWKIFYYAYLLVIPIMFIPASAGHIVAMFVMMHLITGVLLSIIFQPAHVFPDTVFSPETTTQIDHHYVVHQFLTTTNFTLKDPFFSNIAGGLNYQIEHHLFPNICHVHYPALAHIVRKTAEAYGVPYYQEDNLINALKSHTQMLKKLGRED